jgi:transcriptional regulator GlxA family with amidase domain
MENGYTRSVAIVLYQGVEVLDFAGPAEVFAAAARQGDYRGTPAFNVYTVATTRDAIVSQGFIDVVPDYALADAPAADLIVIPGGSSNTMLDDTQFMDWLAASQARAQVTLTVCTGAMAPAVLGLLDGLTVTTHHGSINQLQRLAPMAHVVRDVRFVDNGHIITTAGVSAGIDGSLHLVARLLGLAVAQQTARYMEYNWQPETTQLGAYPALNPSLDERGRELQQATIDAQAEDWPAAESRLRRVLDSDAHDGYAWMLLTEVLRGQERWTDALDAARRTAALPGYEQDGPYLEACTLARLGRTNAALDALQAAIDNGFMSRWHLEQEPDLEPLREHERFAALLTRVRDRS